MRAIIKIDDLELSIGTMFCIGQNYADHIKEMGGSPLDEPLIFIKPPQAYVSNNSVVPIPDFTQNMHYEVELVAIIGKECRNIDTFDTLDYVAGYAVGIDLTLRDLQQKAKNSGTPWAVAKGFAYSAPISDFISSKTISDPQNLEIELILNGETRQKSNTSMMQRSLAEFISYLSYKFGLLPGDVIFTGTPEGVGKINPKDRIKAILKQDNTILTSIDVSF